MLALAGIYHLRRMTAEAGKQWPHPVRAGAGLRGRPGQRDGYPLTLRTGITSEEAH
jgi:hypothetical protein